ncbi:MAG: hypothetical protein IKP10_06470 [Clostridia bacterium]|nr:hypothetical protein [Clostridia bacterium]
MRNMRRHPFLGALLNVGRYALVILLTYLLHVCLMPYIRIGNVTPNLILAVTAVITVCFERTKTFWAGLIFGILLETMQPSLPLFNLLLYPVAAIIGLLFFADKSMQRLEYERSLGKPGRNVPFWIRIPLCALADTAVYEVVNLTYVYLRSGDFSLYGVSRGLLDIHLTALLAGLLMFPLRRFFGIRTAPDPSLRAGPVPYRGRQ